MNPRTAALMLIALIALAGILTYAHYFNTWYAIDRGRAHLSRAETSAFADGMAASISEAIELIPPTGNPVWWFPTARTDFELIQHDLNGFIERTTILEAMPKERDAYQQGMDDLRGKLKTVQEQLGEASAFFFVDPFSLLISLFWIIAVSILLALRSRGFGKEKTAEP
ncbi:MAG: hypothetical protein V3R13_00660 [Nitrososphaerales archaeon]